MGSGSALEALDKYTFTLLTLLYLHHFSFVAVKSDV